MTNSIRHENALNYIFSGYAVVGIHSAKTGDCYWYYVKRIRDDLYNVRKHGVSYNTPATVVWVKRSSENSAEFINPSHIHRKHRSVFQYTVNKLCTGTLDDRVTILHNGRCGKCGRMLTDPESMEYGLGPVCRKTQ